MFRGIMWIWIVMMILVAGLPAGGAGQADVLDKTYTVEDYEEGGKLYEENKQQYPEYMQFLESDREQSLWTKQLVCAILNGLFGMAYSVALFAESHQWVPWFMVANVLILVTMLYTIYVFAKQFRAGYLLDLIDLA